MPLIAITRDVSPSINHCVLSFHGRETIDVAKATAQHKAYQVCLAKLGVHVVPLPGEPELPDSVFVEDPAVVVDEIAIIANMGALSRRPEARSLAIALAHYRPLKFVSEPATLDGGDVLRIGRTVFVGLSQRTNSDGIGQITELLRPYDYSVQPVPVRGCLHLKSGCSYIGNNTMLVHRSWIDSDRFRGFDLLDVPEAEPAAANALLIEKTVILPSAYPQTQAVSRSEGVKSG
ncbi:MAG: arginine deiminase family protein [Verrucomicrobiota bacterium]|nr:arginine deiminase family protein [Verrucomicrobiota bacterium]